MTGNPLADTLPPDLTAEAVTWRHHLHQHPELAYQERQTSDFIASQLGKAGLAVHRGLAGTGVVGTLSRGTGRRALAIRADMDALPIEEQSGVEYRSRNPGVMHACGHDGHVAMVLAAARACADLPNLNGTVHFVFQPAEENEGGAKRMVEDGLFRLFPCDSVYALHNWPGLPLGTCVARDGAVMAAFAVFEIQLSGRGCHAAMPHEGTDAILAGCHVVSALHTIASRNVEPVQAAVVSATQIHAGDTWNVIPDSCTIRGTTRWFDDRVGNLLECRIVELAKSIATGFGCEASVHYERRAPATINDPETARIMRSLASAPDINLDVVDALPSMGAEDFAYMLQQVPGCYFWLGTGKAEGTYGLHSPRYDFNDEVLPIGAALWVSLVKQSLSGA